MVRPGDEPLTENDTDIEIIAVSEYEPKRIPSQTRQIRRGEKDLAGMYKKDIVLSMSKYERSIL